MRRRKYQASSSEGLGGHTLSDRGAVVAAKRQELLPAALGAVILGFAALLVCYSRGYLLLYGDAVAHLAIARRIFDSRNPGLAQLGGVWLPLPHLLMLPFVGNMAWWHNGMAGAWPSVCCYVLGVTGFYRLSRYLLPPKWALTWTAFYALNPNLLYLSTTAMTEPLFLALIVWITLLCVEFGIALGESRFRRANGILIVLGGLILAAVLTRYDGWVLGALVWLWVLWKTSRSEGTWRKTAFGLAIFSFLVVAGPLAWLAYNQHFFHDPLDFLRGPYSAAAIEKKTSPPHSRHYRGWHNPGWALLFYTRTAQVDAAAWETGFVVLLASLMGFVRVLRKRLHRVTILLWLPLPFYVYSIAYGSVPIFIPQLYPHSFYNARYGMGMLPAFALFSGVAAVALERWLEPRAPLAGRLLQPVMLGLAAANSIAMMYRVPLVLKEGIVNSTTRVAFEAALAREIDLMPVGAPILMYNSDHVGAIQQAGISLRQTVNEGDYDSWHAALEAPAEHAAYVVAIAGDAVSKAVAEHPAGLTELTVLCTTGQPCARIYKSERVASGPARNP